MRKISLSRILITTKNFQKKILVLKPELQAQQMKISPNDPVFKQPREKQVLNHFKHSPETSKISQGQVSTDRQDKKSLKPKISKFTQTYALQQFYNQRAYMTVAKETHVYTASFTQTSIYTRLCKRKTMYGKVNKEKIKKVKPD